MPTPGPKSERLKSDYVAPNRPRRGALYGPATVQSGTRLVRGELPGDLPPARLMPRDTNVLHLPPRDVFRMALPLHVMAPARRGLWNIPLPSHRRPNTVRNAVAIPHVSANSISPSPLPKSDVSRPPMSLSRANPMVALDKDNVGDMPADCDDVSESPASPRESRQSQAPEPSAPALATTEEQWEGLKASAMQSVREYIDSSALSDGEGDAVTDGRPAAWVLNRARAFGPNHRERRLPTHPTPEVLGRMAPEKLRSAMQTYARRLVRASVPPDAQKRAAWSNFATRTSRAADRLISNDQVNHPPSSIWPRVPLRPTHYALAPTSHPPCPRRSPWAGRGRIAH